jgi:hypothetical protein
MTFKPEQNGFSTNPDQRYKIFGDWAKVAFVPPGLTMEEATQASEPKVVEKRSRKATRRVFTGKPDSRYQAIGAWAEEMGYLPEEPTLEEIKNT